MGRGQGASVDNILYGDLPKSAQQSLQEVVYWIEEHPVDYARLALEACRPEVDRITSGLEEEIAAAVDLLQEAPQGTYNSVSTVTITNQGGIDITVRAFEGDLYLRSLEVALTAIEIQGHEPWKTATRKLLKQRIQPELDFRRDCLAFSHRSAS